MTTLSDLVERTRRHLYTETRDEIDKLGGTINSSVSTLTLVYGRAGVREGAVLSCGLEEMLVWTRSGSSVTVQRGFNGTTAAAHTEGDMIRVNPKVSDAAIAAAINDDLADLSSPSNGLYATTTVALTYLAGTGTYDLTSAPASLIRVLRVAYDGNDGTERWPEISPSLWRFQRGLNTSDFPSGMALTVNGWAEPGRPLRVTYARPFVALSALADNVETVSGLPATAHDIPPMGAAILLTVGDEVARNRLVQGDTRRADEVPPQARAASTRSLAMRRRERIGAELSRLTAKYPTVVAR